MTSIKIKKIDCDDKLGRPGDILTRLFAVITAR